MHPEFQALEIFPEIFVNQIIIECISMCLLIRFTSLEENISCILKSRYINFYITNIKKTIFLFYSVLYSFGVFK